MDVECRDARRTILGPGEKEDEERYVVRRGLAAQAARNFSAFRCAERKYKNRKSTLDLSQAFDTSNIDGHAAFERVTDLNFEDSCHSSGMFCSNIANKCVRVYAYKDSPGFVVLPALFEPSEQIKLLEQCFLQCMKHPNLTNLDAHYMMPTEGIVRGVLANKQVSIKPLQDGCDETVVDEQFLKKIRWCTIGRQYEWTSKEYAPDDANEFPPLIGQAALEIAQLMNYKDYKPEAGVINYYQFKHTLMGHVDRSEKNMKAPLVSISIGCSCIFLLGGQTRDDPVQAFLLNSGDAVLLTGPSRKCYHGVPRVIENSLPLYLKLTSDDSPEILKLIKDSRININIRQVN